jgi:hypothetical protein
MMHSSAIGRTHRAIRESEIEFPAGLSGAELIEAGKRLIEEARQQLIESTHLPAGNRSAAARFTRFHDSLLRGLYRYLLQAGRPRGGGIRAR